MRARRAGSGGFILTLELLVLLSIFGVVIVFALALAQRYFVQSVADPFGRTVFIYDSTQPMGSSVLVGRAVGFNPFESPLIVYRIPAPSAPVAALLAVRPANFTTRQSVYYAGAACTGATYLLDPTNPTAGTVGEVSELYAAQGTAFAIGTDGASRNVLFRSTPGASPASTPQSRWVSERYVNLCEPVADDAVLRAALLPASVVSDMSAIFVPPYWTPTQSQGVGTPPQSEGDPWP
ncbi:MAG: hypothetical protein ABI779_27015 [Acidobacteriota bacterium]